MICFLVLLGRVVTLVEAERRREIADRRLAYIGAQDGHDVYLTIDINIQRISEQRLSRAVRESHADSGNVIVMNPQTGDILAMASYPDFNLNQPFVPNATNYDYWNSLNPGERNHILYNMWRNTAVQNTFEPGSTFKFITAAAGIEENRATLHGANAFYCSGSEAVGGLHINCWRHDRPHGHQSLNEAFGGSCNPAFMQLARQIGTPTMYKYFEAFGLFNRTNSGLYGESGSVFHNIENVGATELATMSFGQRFNITPLQLITAVSAIANDGVLMEPNIVSQVRNTETGVITVTEPTPVRQVLSSRTAEQLMEMSLYTVTDGTGGRARVPGFVVGGKSGTSEPPVRKTRRRFHCFICRNDSNCRYTASSVSNNTQPNCWASPRRTSSRTCCFSNIR